MQNQVLGLKYALSVSREQAALFAQFAGARRHVYNWGLAQRIEAYQTTKTSLSYTDQAKAFTLYKHETENEWLTSVHSQVPQQALRDLDQAFQSFFRKQSRFPRFKSRKNDVPRFRIPQSIRVDRDKLYVPKIGWVRFRKSREIDGMIKSARFKQSASGRWFVSLTIHRVVAIPTPKPVRLDTTVGVDQGLKHSAILSDGSKIDNPKAYARAERKLARLQRSLSRKEKGSCNRTKARVRIARQHEKVRNIRLDHLHKLSTRLTRQFDTLGVETLDARALAKTKLGKHVLDAGWGTFSTLCAYKAEWAGKHWVKADRFFPSTRQCNVCHSLTGPRGVADLGIRRWVCSFCHTEHDRDINAAHNLKFIAFTVAAGLAETLNACGEAVRPWNVRAHLDEAGTHIPTPAAKAA